MRTRLVLAKAALFILSMVLVAMAACDPVVRVEGTVRDPQGNPLGDVNVTLLSEGRPPRKTATAKDGSFSVGMVGADARQTKLQFQKDGYRRIEKPMGDDDAELQVTLEPEVR